MFLDQREGGIRTLFEYVFYLFIIIFPFASVTEFLYGPASGRALLTMLLVEILAIILGFVLFKKNLTIKIYKSPIIIALGVYLLAVIVSSFFGVDPGASMWSKAPRISGIFYLIHLAFFLLSLLMIIWNDKTKEKLIKILLISTGIYSVFALMGPEGFKWIYASKEWDGFTFGNSSFAGMYLFATFMLSIYYVLTRKIRKWYHYLIPFVFLINPSILNAKLWFGKANISSNPLGFIGEAQASTYAIIGSALALICVYFISKVKNSKTRKQITIIGAVVGSIVITFAIFSLLNPNGFIHKKYLSQSSGARPIVWQLAREAIKEKPIFGWGMDNFDRAFEAHYDNRLLEQKNGAEAWFDRAHNIIIDQKVDTGYVGLITYLAIYATIIVSMIYVIIKSKIREDQILGVILGIYFVFHLAELQTAFDTVISYPILALMSGFAIMIFHRTYTSEVGEAKTEWIVPQWLRYTIGVMLIGFFGWAMFGGTMKIWGSEIAFAKIHSVGSSEGRIANYKKAFSSPMDEAGFLWRISTDLQRGIAEDPTAILGEKKQEGFKEELDQYTQAYESYIERNPNDYRSILTLADILIYQRLFEVNRLAEAQEVLDSAIKMHPNIPQPYWMKSVAYLYMGKFDLAREWAKKGLDINPNIELSQDTVKYINDSVKTFPEIDLRFFTHI